MSFPTSPDETLGASTLSGIFAGLDISSDLYRSEDTYRSLMGSLLLSFKST